MRETRSREVIKAKGLCGDMKGGFCLDVIPAAICRYDTNERGGHGIVPTIVCTVSR